MDEDDSNELFLRWYAVFHDLEEVQKQRAQADSADLARREAELSAEFERLDAELKVSERQYYDSLSTLPELRIDAMTAPCPVQVWGLYRDHPFYFRARWQGWGFSISENIREDPEFCGLDPSVAFSKDGTWGEDEAAAGNMPDEEAVRIIEKCCREYDVLNPMYEAFHAGQIDAKTWAYVLWIWCVGRDAMDKAEAFSYMAESGIATGLAEDPDGILQVSGDSLRVRTLSERIHAANLGEPSPAGRPPAIIDVLHRCCAYLGSGHVAGIVDLFRHFDSRLQEWIWRGGRVITLLLPADDEERLQLRFLLLHRERIEALLQDERGTGRDDADA